MVKPPVMTEGSGLKAEAFQAGAPVHRNGGPMGSGLVLICDDDPLLTELLEHRLGQRGYRTAVVRDGGEALAFLAERPPDAVIMESMLLVHDGHEVLRHIRKSEGLKDLPVIMLSARRLDRDIVEALELGASDYMTKPFILDELVARLARLVGDHAR
jgi:DNA-binding response OmpR family regulator